MTKSGKHCGKGEITCYEDVLADLDLHYSLESQVILFCMDRFIEDFHVTIKPAWRAFP